MYFRDLGHRLSITALKACPAKFLPGDTFDNGNLFHTAPIDGQRDLSDPPVACVNTHRIRGRISVIHPFGKENQFGLGTHLAVLLDRPSSRRRHFGFHDQLTEFTRCPAILKSLGPECGRNGSA